MLTQQGTVRTLGTDVFSLNVSHHPLLFDAPFVSLWLIPSSAPLIPPPSLMSSRPNSLHISFPPFHLAPSLVLSPWPTPSNPFSSSRADSAAGFGAHTRLCVRWEQVMPQVAGWPYYVTLAPTHIMFVWDAASFSFRLLSSLYERHTVDK